MQKTTLQYANEIPQPIDIQVNCGMKQRTINFDVEDAETESYTYRWKRVTLPIAVWSYEAIVSAIINAEYPADSMQAINNNYLRTIDGTELSEEKRDEYTKEHLEMNAYRDHAKVVAKDLLAYAEAHNL